MSSNELDSYQQNDLAPYQPGGLDLYQPSAEDQWGEQPDYLDSHAPAHGQLPQHVEANLQALAQTFETDMASLGFVNADIHKAMDWFRNSLINPVQRMPAKKHSYELWQFSNDEAMNAFANYAATQKFSQRFIQSICYWVQQLENVMAGQQQVRHALSSNPEDSLSDSQYEAVVVANERARANTLGRLRDLWGSSFEANMRVVQQHFASLTDAEQAHLSQFTGNWVRGVNTFEIVTSLYAQAVQAHTIPRNGAAIAQEIRNIENYMKTNRGAYMKDEVTQARYRELLTLRDG